MREPRRNREAGRRGKNKNSPRLSVSLLLLSLSACGYRPVYGDSAPERFAVVLVGSNVPDLATSDEVVAGVRDELARAGALSAGDAYPRCEVEVLRADESSEGIAAEPNVDGRLLPQARATRVGVLAHAWVQRTKESPRERDTGDVSAAETVATATDAKADALRHADSSRAAARRAGRRLGARILGLPAASD